MAGVALTSGKMVRAQPGTLRPTANRKAKPVPRISRGSFASNMDYEQVHPVISQHSQVSFDKG